MMLDVKKVTQKEFDEYWTPDVRKLLDKYIYETKKWAVNFDKRSKYEKKWVMDLENEITLMTVSVLVGIDHPSEMQHEDIAVVSKDGSIGLLKYFCDDLSNDMYKIILLTGIFENSIEEFKKLVLKSLDMGGLRLNGRNMELNQIIHMEKVAFFDCRGGV